MRRVPRKPLTTKGDSSVIAAVQSPSKVQKLLTRLSTFVRHFESALPSLRETITTLDKLSSDVLALSQTSTTQQSVSRDVARTWLSVKSRLPGLVSEINSIDLVNLASNEFESFERIIDDVNDKSALSRDHRNAHKHLTASIKRARNHLADDELGPFQSELRALRSDVSQHCESFFRLSHAADDCRASLDRLTVYGELWTEIGSVQVPEFVGEITSAIDQLTPATKRPSSLIPRLSPRCRDQKTPTVVRSNSVSNVPNRKSRPAAAGLRSAPRTNPRQREEPKRRSGRSFSAGSQVSADDPFFSELREFEKRIDRHTAAVIANDRFKAFVGEIKALQKFRRKEPHLTKLKTLMGQIETEIAAGQPSSQLEERFRDAATALVVAKKQLNDVKVPNAKRLAENLDMLGSVMEAIPPNPQRRACSGVAALVAKLSQQFSSEGAGHQNQISELRVVQARINTLRAERKRAATKYRCEIDAELEDLMNQQTDLIAILATHENC
jgi:hypothetical protein